MEYNINIIILIYFPNLFCNCSLSYQLSNSRIDNLSTTRIFSTRHMSLDRNNITHASKKSKTFPPIFRFVTLIDFIIVSKSM